MNNDTLEQKKEELIDRINLLSDQIKQVDDNVQRLFKTKEELVANYQATNGALQLVFEFLKLTDECPVQATSQ